MSEEAVVEKKGRGRPKANGTTAAITESKDNAKKRGRTAAPVPTPPAKVIKESAKSSDDEQPAVKRGRGRPKGTKKKMHSKSKKLESGGSRGRGRPRKSSPAPAASDEDEEPEDEDDDEGSDE